MQKKIVLGMIAVVVIVGVYLSLKREETVIVTTDKAVYKIGKDNEVKFKITNNTIKEIAYFSSCYPKRFERLSEKNYWEVASLAIETCPDMLSNQEYLKRGDSLIMSSPIESDFVKVGTYRAFYKHDNKIYYSKEFLIQ